MSKKEMKSLIFLIGALVKIGTGESIHSECNLHLTYLPENSIAHKRYCLFVFNYFLALKMLTLAQL